ncbi:MAG: hypothetical protein CMO55_16400 [Verrucomicrobiales bacterium]|nr:hypothetical protein [Verrucomicrobiales bacterium]
MKVFSTVLAITFLTCSLTQAGWNWNKEAYHSAKSPMVEQKITSPSYCYDIGWEFSLFASGAWADVANIEGEYGGGLGLTYFLGHNFGIGVEYMKQGGAPIEHVGRLGFNYRMPLGGECCSTIAPYVFGGPGIVGSNSSDMLWYVGGGLDLRFESWGCTGLFADYSYNWVDDNPADFAIIRAGIRVPW